ncbi:MAG: carbohydrate kinase family protein [Candidatus Bathyarchaeia archaeon]
MIVLLVLTTGILVVDIIAAELPRIADQGELLYVPSGIAVTLGGHAGNVSIDLLQLGLKAGDVYLASVVGRDVFGDFVERFLTERGVRVRLNRVDAPTSKNLILVVKGEDRRFHVDAGSNLFLDRKFIEDTVEELKPRVFYIGGAGMLGEFDYGLPEVLDKARSIGALTFLDIVAPYSKGWDFFREAIPHCDIFHCNLLEASKITSEENALNALKSLKGLGCKFPIITMGDKGLIALFKNILIEMPAFKVNVVDPTGAGDAFCAGLIFKLVEEPNRVENYTVEKIIDGLIFGSASGAVCCTAKGTTTSVKRGEVESLLKVQLDDLRRKIKLKEV